MSGDRLATGIDENEVTRSEIEAWVTENLDLLEEGAIGISLNANADVDAIDCVEAVVLWLAALRRSGWVISPPIPGTHVADAKISSAHTGKTLLEFQAMVNQLRGW